MEPNITKIINMHEFTVSELNKAIQGTLEGKFENIRVRGEISGLSKASSGHIYFSLKDNEFVIRRYLRLPHDSSTSIFFFRS